MLSFLQSDEIDGLNDHATANLMITAFLDPMKAYQDKYSSTFKRRLNTSFNAFRGQYFVSFNQTELQQSRWP